LDLVASNWGLNTPYRASDEWPIRLYFGGFAGSPTVEVVESVFDRPTQKWVPSRALNPMAVAIPALRDRFPTHQDYSQAGIQDILGRSFATASVLSANTLASCVFLNRGGRFEAVPLPPEAQWSPGFGLTVADFDGDTREDVFLSQNYFAVGPHTPRQDSGRGLLLQGDGSGGFTPMAAAVSGVAVYGEQRACASADYDHDGRVDLVVTQNGAPTRLFRNQSARPGLRVRLSGTSGNAQAIGASLRLKSPGAAFPRKELHAGSGYWSQDGLTQVLPQTPGPAQIEVRWPDGKVTLSHVPPAAKELEIRPGGEVRVLP
jgi:hypothetical protein